MTVHVIVDDIAAFLLPHAVGKRADPRDVMTCKEPHSVLIRQPFAVRDLLLDIHVFIVQSLRLPTLYS